MTDFPRAAYRKLKPYDPDRRPVEVDLSDNTNLWGPHPAAASVVRSAAGELLSRYPTVYASPLKEAVAQRFGVPADSVTTGCGSDDLLDSLFRAASPPGRGVTYPSPTFSMVGAFARMNDLDPRPVDWAEAEADPASLLRDDPAVVYVCRPNNPTGSSVTREWTERLLDSIAGDGPVLALDEAYADFAADTFIGEASRHPRLVVLRTLSKAYGLAGMRVGFAVAHPAVALEAEKSRGPYKVNHVAERAAAAAIRDREGWVEQIVDAVVRNRARLAGELAKLGVSTLPSDANFLLLQCPEGRSSREILQGLRERGIGVRPFPILPGIGDSLRVTVGPWEMMERFIASLREVLG